MNKKDPLLMQSTIKTVFEDLLSKYFSQVGASCSTECERELEEEPQFTQEELNALRYACGYVPHKLLKKYEKRTGKKADQFEMCLGEMSVAGGWTDLRTYTTKWLDLVNRGGLFPLNDRFFVQLKHWSENCYQICAHRRHQQ